MWGMRQFQLECLEGLYFTKPGVYLVVRGQLRFLHVLRTPYCIGFHRLRWEMGLDQVTGTATSAAETPSRILRPTLFWCLFSCLMVNLNLNLYCRGQELVVSEPLRLHRRCLLLVHWNAKCFGSFHGENNPRFIWDNVNLVLSAAPCPLWYQTFLTSELLQVKQHPDLVTLYCPKLMQRELRYCAVNTFFRQLGVAYSALALLTHKQPLVSERV
jgi:hypothetical protein